MRPPCRRCRCPTGTASSPPTAPTPARGDACRIAAETSRRRLRPLREHPHRARPLLLLLLPAVRAVAPPRLLPAAPPCARGPRSRFGLPLEAQATRARSIRGRRLAASHAEERELSEPARVAGGRGGVELSLVLLFPPRERDPSKGFGGQLDSVGGPLRSA